MISEEEADKFNEEQTRIMNEMPNDHKFSIPLVGNITLDKQRYLAFRVALMQVRQANEDSQVEAEKERFMSALITKGLDDYMAWMVRSRIAELGEELKRRLDQRDGGSTGDASGG